MTTSRLFLLLFCILPAGIYAQAGLCCDRPGWEYVLEIDIDNTCCSQAYSNHSIAVMVNTATPVAQGKMRADGADIRFADGNCNAEIDYWIESGMNSPSTLIWVRVPSIPAFGTERIFMYYGNAGANTTASFANVFPNSATWNTAQTLSGVQTFDWLEIQPGANISTQNGQLLTIQARRILFSGTINGDGRGYGPQAGPGAGGNGNGGVGGGGGGYGGRGGGGGNNNGGSQYGTQSGQDIDFGSGGGGSDCNATASGGGAVRLEASMIDIEGTISMNGQNAVACCCNDNSEAAGGAAGGGIFVEADFINGNAGVLRANGGRGGDSDRKEGGGGGAGGRIKFFFTNANTYSGNTSVSGGQEGSGPQCCEQPGQDGTFQVRQVAGLSVNVLAERPIIVMPEPAFGFEQICSRTATNFSDSSSIASGNIVSWTWSFGDGSPTDNNSNTSHIYASGGSFNVSLTTVSDSGCSATANQSLNIGDKPNAQFDVTPVCASDSSRFANQSSTVPPNNLSSFRWNFGDGSPESNLSDPVYAYRDTGNYSVSLIAINDQGCADTFTRIASVNQLPQLGLTPTDPSCAGQNDGRIRTLIIGGTANFTYQWSNGETTPVIDSLPAGTYSLHVSDANGCSTFDSTTLTDPTLLEATLQSSDARCFGASDGTINVSPSGASPPYSYSWNTTATSQNLSGLSAGNYSVTISDNNGCTLQRDTLIGQPTQMQTQIDTFSIACFGGTDGRADLNLSGGTPPYRYAWSNGQQSQNASNLSVGTWFVTVTDTNQCEHIDSVSLSQPAATQSQIIPSAVACFGGTDGSADLSILSGRAPFSYVWSNAAQTEDISGLVAGNYFVTISDSNGCATFDTTVVTEPRAIDLSVAVDSISCFGGSDGLATAILSGGTLPYSYTWSNGAQNATAAGFSMGQAALTVSDANGCTDSLDFFVPQPDSIEILLQILHVSCFQATDGSILALTTGGTPNFTFSWSNNQQVNPIEGLAPGNYSLTATDAKGCIATATAAIEDHLPILLEIDKDSTSCFGNQAADATATIMADVASDHRPLMYSINGGDFETDAVFTNLAAGIYFVDVIDAQGCTQSTSFDILEPPPILPEILADTQIIEAGQSVAFETMVPLMQGNFDYSWSPTTGLSCGDCQNPVASPMQDITYQVTVEDLSDLRGPCAGSALIRIQVIHRDELFIPNVFTPNGDGVNDDWRVFSEQIQEITIKVFDRTGTMVFSSDSPFKPWNGSYKGEKVNPGVYTYFASGMFFSGEEFLKKGSVTVVR